MSDKAITAKSIYNILESADCFGNCPLKEVCDLVENESHNNTICRILDREKENLDNE